jgi:uncharacterized protein YkwD
MNKLIVLFFCVAHATSAQDCRDGLAGFHKAMLEVTNAKRALHCSPPLVEDAELTRLAQNYSSRLAARASGLAHKINQGPYGENLYMEMRSTADTCYSDYITFLNFI